MEAPPPPKPASSHNLFEVYLRLRPPAPGLPAPTEDRILSVDEDAGAQHASHITLNPPTDRRRAIEKFAFTHVFAEDATQLDVFHRTELVSLAEGVLAPQGGEGTDAVVATLGVTGSGKTHTILGSRSQRGLTQLALDVLFRSIGPNMLEPAALPSVLESLQACDPSESALSTAPHFLDSTYADPSAPSRANSRAATPMIVRSPQPLSPAKSPGHAAWLPSSQSQIPCTYPVSATASPKSVRLESFLQRVNSPLSPVGQSATAFQSPKRARPTKHFMSLTAACRVKNAVAKQDPQGDHSVTSPPPRRNLQQPSALPQSPEVSGIHVSCDPSAEYVMVVSMYEVHNDRIYDLLTPPSKSAATKDFRRRPLLFKSTELSPDRKVVAGLRKVVCTSLREAITVLEAGLLERRVAGTGSNSVSSRSHGFFCFEVKKRTRSRRTGSWGGSKLTIVDLAGSERAREAKTQGATLVEAGKINESLMYLGQCLQTQSEVGGSSKPNVVPYRQCKLTELLFSNSFPSSSAAAHPHAPRRNPQRGVMIVTADPRGDFNATSQILRYSALAREVTVPRIPSITATILAAAPPTGNPLPQHAAQHHPRPFMPPGSSSYRNHTPPSGADDRATMEIAALEIARLSDDIDQLRDELEHQTDARLMAEAHLLSMEDRMLDLEAAMRDDCATEFEQRLTLELARFKVSLALEQERNDEHWDRKVDVLERGLDDSNPAGECDKENVLVEDLAQEVERLRRENAVLKRELAGRSPSKRTPLAERDDFVSTGTSTPNSASGSGVANLGRKLERMRLGSNADSMRKASGASNGSPSKKARKLGTKRWEELDELQ
ncbi:Kinesin-like motor protein 9 [Tolypocladium ophioglossoides CBS 100239]|uniref:Kinesin-like protein n=1 Tax=Tolypocladium ophioglossoides (strain CBS 100239) TaxID=1163406 RepID=A0A0L0MW37_TOLOC|nr:Kinesin-like motor protein 9 [Tolypocladium ophioglossoides CBS 100239]